MTPPNFVAEARATVPLFGIDFQATGRTELAPGVVLAELTARESERVRTHLAWYNGPLPTPTFRLEIFIETLQSDEGSRAHSRVRQALQLLACVANVFPRWFSIPVDRFSLDRNIWVRSTLRDDSGGRAVVSLFGRPPAIISFFGFDQAIVLDCRSSTRRPPNKLLKLTAAPQRDLHHPRSHPSK